MNAEQISAHLRGRILGPGRSPAPAPDVGYVRNLEHYIATMKPGWMPAPLDRGFKPGGIRERALEVVARTVITAATGEPPNKGA